MRTGGFRSTAHAAFALPAPLPASAPPERVVPPPRHLGIPITATIPQPVIPQVGGPSRGVVRPQR
jgi:hypothetical protein